MATTSVVSSGLASIAPEIAPYYTGTSGAPGLLPTAQSIYSKDYATQFGAPLAASGLGGTGRVAGLSDAEQQVGNQLMGMQTPGQFATGTNAINGGLGSLAQATNAYNNVGNVSNQNLQKYQMAGTQDVNAQNLNTYQMNGPDQYNNSAVSQYMTPYMQNVVDVQKQAAMRDAQKQLVGANLASSRQGTYGGARNALMQSEADRNLQTQMGTIQATGSQNAFQNAQQQFNTSQQAQQAANQANLNAALGVQQLGSGQSLQAQLANQAAQQATGQTNLQAQLGVQQLGSAQSLQAQLANQAAQLQAAQGYGQLGATAGQLGATAGQLGTEQSSADLNRLAAQSAYGGTQRAITQQGLDTRYQDLMQQINYPKEQLAGMQGILTGVNTPSTSSTQTTTTPAPSFASQLSGAGMGGLALYNMFK